MSVFKKFLLRGNVVDLAVAVVIGAAFGAVATAFVKAFITPLIGVFGGIPDFSAWAFTVNGSRFPIGEFVNALLSFIVIATVVYFFVVVPMNRLMDRFKGEEPVGPKTRECPECLSRIPEAARRCAFCTADVGGVEADGLASAVHRRCAPARTGGRIEPVYVISYRNGGAAMVDGRCASWPEGTRLVRAATHRPTRAGPGRLGGARRYPTLPIVHAVAAVPPADRPLSWPGHPVFLRAGLLAACRASLSERTGRFGCSRAPPLQAGTHNPFCSPAVPPARETALPRDSEREALVIALTDPRRDCEERVRPRYAEYSPRDRVDRDDAHRRELEALDVGTN